MRLTAELRPVIAGTLRASRCIGEGLGQITATTVSCRVSPSAPLASPAPFREALPETLLANTPMQLQPGLGHTRHEDSGQMSKSSRARIASVPTNRPHPAPYSSRVVAVSKTATVLQGSPDVTENRLGSHVSPRSDVQRLSMIVHRCLRTAPDYPCTASDVAPAILAAL